jgi:hypothetical protein
LPRFVSFISGVWCEAFVTPGTVLSEDLSRWGRELTPLFLLLRTPFILGSSEN